MHRIRALIATALVASAILAVPSPAMAKAGDVVRAGNCSGAADWKLKVSPDNGRWEVEFQVDTNRVGRTWRVRIYHNGVLRLNTLRTTTAPSGAFTVRRLVPNMAGTDTIVVRARNVTSGQLCVGKVTV